MRNEKDSQNSVFFLKLSTKFNKNSLNTSYVELERRMLMCLKETLRNQKTSSQNADSCQEIVNFRLFLIYLIFF